MMKNCISLLLVFAIFISLLSLFSCSEEIAKEKEVTAITLSDKNITFREIGESLQITAGITPFDAVDQTLEWVSADPRVATCVDGLVTAVGYGVCVVKAISKSGISSSCVVTVGTTTPTLHLSSEVLKFSEIGAVQMLTPTTTVGTITASDVTWISSNESIASCNKGIVTANGYGICNITAISAVGAKAVCTVVVEEENKPFLYISQTEIELSGIDQTVTLTATVSNDAAMKIHWISSDNSVAVVNAGKITATGFGKCAIIAVAENGLSAYTIVKVGDEEKLATGYENDILFDIPNLPVVASYVNRGTGQLESKLVVLSYEIKIYDHTTSPDLEDGVLGLMVQLKCIKYYDKDGLEGKAPVVATVNTYRDEAGIFCDSKTYKKTDYGIGEVVTLSIPIRVAKVEGQQRYFYLTLSEYTII